MKRRSTDKPVRKSYDSPKLVVYGKVSELTEGKGGGKGNAAPQSAPGRKKGRGHGGSRS